MDEEIKKILYNHICNMAEDNFYFDTGIDYDGLESDVETFVKDLYEKGLKITIEKV